MSVRYMARLVCALLALAGLATGLRWLTAPAGAMVTIEWSTASELNTAGFYLYRSASPDGPYTRVNDNLIPASPDPLVGGSYVFTDTGVTAGHTYYYQLEDVETSGQAARHGPLEVKAERSDTAAGLVALVFLGAAIIGWTLTLDARRSKI
jgi:hypothetical protein